MNFVLKGRGKGRENKYLATKVEPRYKEVEYNKTLL